MILVTGASGLLGATFMVTAQQRKRELVAAFCQHPFHLPGVKGVMANLKDYQIADRLLQSFRPKWVVHFAALTNVDWCERNSEETWQVNVEASSNLAQACQRFGAGLVYLSTDSVFDGKTGHYVEKDPPSPVNVYGRSKLAGEQAVRDKLQRNLIIRTNIYGWSANAKSSLAEWILTRLQTRQSVLGFSDVFFTPILTNDLSEILLDMMEQDLTGLYHVAGSESFNKYEFALHLADVFGMDKKLVKPSSVASSTLRAPRPRNTSLVTRKITQVLGRRMPDMQSGLKRFKALGDSGFVGKLKALRGEHDAKD